MEWLSTLVTAGLGAFATIFAACLGAIATVVAALISKAYINRNTKKMKDVLTPDSKVATLRKALNYFHVSEAIIFDVKEESAFIDDTTGLVISVHTIYTDALDFSYQLPKDEKAVSVSEGPIGWRKTFKFRDDVYAITLVNIEVLNEVARFDFRRID